MKRTLISFLRSTFLSLAGLAVLLFAAAPALAAPQAPAWLPMQPMLAGNQIIAMWLPIPGAVKYILYLNGEKVTESPANQWMGSAPEKAGVYKYEVSAVDGSGAESPKSIPGVITIIALEPPAKPIFRPDEADRSVQLRWAKPTNAAVYNVYRAESKDGPWNLLTSIQEEIYKDSNLEWAKSYFYTVSAKDVSGKESGRSEMVEVFLKKPKVQVAADPYVLKILRTKETAQLDFFGDLDLNGLGGLTLSPGNRIFALYGDMIVNLSDDLKAEEAFLWPGNTRTFEKVKTRPIVIPAKLKEKLPEPVRIVHVFFIDDETLLLTDSNNNRIMECDLGAAEITWVSGPLGKPTQEQDPKVFGAQNPTAAHEAAALMSAVKLPNGNYWVCEKNGHTWIEVDSDGEIAGWFAYMLEGEEGEELADRRMGGANNFHFLPNGDLFFEATVERKAFTVDPKNRRLKKTLGGGGPTDIGGFLGFSGVNLTPDKKYAVMADTAVSTVTLWDPANGRYLGVFGDETGKPDVDVPARAAWADWRGASYPILDHNGKRLIVYQAFGNYISVREVVDPLPEIKPPAAPAK